jgi:thiamine-monophosphate kinase
MAGLSEARLIRIIKRTVKSRGRVRLGIGDDAAVLKDGTVITADAYAEGVHFDLSYMSLRQVGARCACGAISDVVAMAAEPAAVLVSLALPRASSEQLAVSSCRSQGEVRGQMLEARSQKCRSGLRMANGERRMANGVRELYRGIESVCKEMGCEVAGGDIIVADQLLLALTVTGKTKTPKLRSGARPGDHLYVTGYLGSAKAGRLLLAEQVRSQKAKAKSQSGGEDADEVRRQKSECRRQNEDTPHPDPLPQGEREADEVRRQKAETGSQKCGRGRRMANGEGRVAEKILRFAQNDRIAQPLVRRHLRPIPRLEAMLALKSRIHGLIDTSDGLSTDARHLCEMSGVRIVLDAEALPVLPATMRFCAEKNLDPIDFVLRAGEDYELLFTSRRRQSDTVGGVKVTRIGRVEKGKGLWVEHLGRVLPVTVSGYDHLEVDHGKTGC